MATSFEGVYRVQTAAIERLEAERDRLRAEVEHGERQAKTVLDSYAAENGRLSDEVACLRAEVERLTAVVKKANAQAEHFERQWYLRGDEVESLRANAAKLRTLLAVVPLPPVAITYELGWTILDAIQAAAIERAAQGDKT